MARCPRTASLGAQAATAYTMHGRTGPIAHCPPPLKVLHSSMHVVAAWAPKSAGREHRTCSAHGLHMDCTWLYVHGRCLARRRTTARARRLRRRYARSRPYP
eukprot:scaffold17921_cov48-Phaeocystis_antarctica.AAC.2